MSIERAKMEVWMVVMEARMHRATQMGNQPMEEGEKAKGLSDNNETDED